jgi:hypothetical protein
MGNTVSVCSPRCSSSSPPAAGDVERLVASLYPQPDIPPSVRRLTTRARVGGLGPLTVETASPAEAPLAAPTVATTGAPTEPAMAALTTTLTGPAIAAACAAQPVVECALVAADVTAPSHRSLVAPLGHERYLLKVTLSRDAHDKLERAQALLRHAIPNGDSAAVIDRALTALVELERRKMATTSRPRVHASRASRTRHVPAPVKRAVWARDRSRCAFVGTHSRCDETAFLEFHHVRPFAVGGATDIDNLQLRCRAHNAYEAACFFGAERRPGAEGIAPRSV